jgi:putative NADH-flavin reductase
MNLFVIGATGRTGREIVEQALARGHDVTAFVRSPESISQRNERLTIVRGNAMDENELRGAMQNHDAVVSTLGSRKVFKPQLDASRQRIRNCARNEPLRSETPRR